MAITINYTPRVTNVLSDTGRLTPGACAHLLALAEDVDGDVLSYSWHTECEGTFDDVATQAPTFTLAALPRSGSCDLVVSVSDGKGGESHGILTLSACPQPQVIVDGPGAVP